MTLRKKKKVTARDIREVRKHWEVVLLENALDWAEYVANGEPPAMVADMERGLKEAIRRYHLATKGDPAVFR